MYQRHSHLSSAEKGVSHAGKGKALAVGSKEFRRAALASRTRDRPVQAIRFLKEFASFRSVYYDSSMIDRLFRFSVKAIPVLWLAACASTPQVNPAVATALSSRGVEQSTQTKVAQGSALNYDDILNLVRKQVPTHIIISTLQSTQRAYNFSSGQLEGLKAAGATTQLLNYLRETRGFYGVNTPKQAARLKGEQRRAYYDTPGYQAQQPFGTPMIDEWVDPGYEESLYSPFSFN